MKEACATLCTAIVEYPQSPSPKLVENAGSLLITAMVSLKHQGAAFAAHNALQQIALACTSYENLLSFPDQWASRILYEISSQETVRDSTLRRSTGYALGLLSLMRTQPSLAATSLAQIVRYSLPSAIVMGENLAKWAGNVSARVEDIFIFPSLGKNNLSSPDMFVSDENYEVSQIPIYLARTIGFVSSHLPCHFHYRVFYSCTLFIYFFHAICRSEQESTRSTY